MVNSINHRGPDESNYQIFDFGEKFLHFGSSRLSITGIIDGSMPMIIQMETQLFLTGKYMNLEN